MDKPKPLVIKVGAVSVPIYNFADDRWMVVYRESKGGPRKRISCATEEAARKEAHKVCLDIARGEINAERLSADERLQAVAARRALAPLGLTLDVAAHEIARAHELTGGASVSEMARFWARHHQSATSSRTVLEVLGEMMAAKAAQGLDAEYLRNVREPLEKFALACPGPIAHLDAAAIRVYLQKAYPVPRTRNNIRASLVMLFRFARAAKDLPDGRTTEAELVGRAKVTKKAPRVYTAVQLREWLEVVRPEWLSWMVLGAFAGIRTKEIERMDWSDIQWITREIYIRPEVAKTGEGRYIPMQDNLVAWLLDHRQGTGPIVPPKGRVNLETARMSVELEQSWDRNALRHSYGSHRLGIIQDLAKLTVEMGNSIQVNRSNYQNPRSRQQCVEYFNLFPAGDKKPIPMPAAS